MSNSIPPRSSATTAATGSDIDFSKRKVFGTAVAPITTTLTTNLTDARLGIVQKIYHQAASFTEPDNWVKLGAVEYVPNVLNLVYVEYCSDTRIEYWLTQEA